MEVLVNAHISDLHLSESVVFRIKVFKLMVVILIPLSTFCIQLRLPFLLNLNNISMPFLCIHHISFTRIILYYHKVHCPRNHPLQF